MKSQRFNFVANIELLWLLQSLLRHQNFAQAVSRLSGFAHLPHEWWMTHSSYDSRFGLAFSYEDWEEMLAFENMCPRRTYEDDPASRTFLMSINYVFLSVSDSYYHMKMVKRILVYFRLFGSGSREKFVQIIQVLTPPSSNLTCACYVS